MKNQADRAGKNRGFTLIELLVVISIISMLSSVVFAAVSGARKRANIGAGATFEHNLYNGLYTSKVAEYDMTPQDANCLNTTLTLFDQGNSAGTLTSAEGSSCSNALITDKPLQSSQNQSLDDTQLNGVDLAGSGGLMPASTASASGFTIATWVKCALGVTYDYRQSPLSFLVPTANASIVQYILGFTVATVAGSDYYKISFVPGGGVKLASQSGTNVQILPAGSLCDGDWHHFAVSADGISSAVKTYVDGRQNGSAQSLSAGSFQTITGFSPSIYQKSGGQVLLNHITLYGAAIP